MDDTVPGKLYFRIGETAELANVKPSVLRFWETQFAEIKPHKSKSGQRVYSRAQVELVGEIRRLLYDEKLTIAGAQQKLLQKESSAGSRKQDVEPGANSLELLKEIKTELKEIQKLLNS